MNKYSRITIDPQKMGGVPCIRDIRMPVATILSMMADGKEISEILEDHPELELEDIHQVLRYASDFFSTIGKFKFYMGDSMEDLTKASLNNSWNNNTEKWNDL